MAEAKTPEVNKWYLLVPKKQAKDTSKFMIGRYVMLSNSYFVWISDGGEVFRIKDISCWIDIDKIPISSQCKGNEGFFEMEFKLSEAERLVDNLTEFLKMMDLKEEFDDFMREIDSLKD